MEPRALTTPDHAAPAPLSHERLLEAFVRGKSLQTVAAYQADLRAFAAWMGVQEPVDAAEQFLGHGAGRAHDLALEWQAALRDAGYAPNTVNRKIASLQALARAAAERDVVPWRLRVPRITVDLVRDTRGPTPEVFARMCELAQGQRDPFLAARDHCLLRMLHDMGLRQVELRTLELHHVDVERLKVSVQGKARAERELLTLPRRTAEVVKAWLEVRGDADGPFLQSRRTAGNPLGASDVGDIVSGLSESAGQRTTPHGLRHLAITEVARITGGDVTQVAAFSRHKDIRVVQAYVDQWRDTAGDLANRLADGE